MIFFFYLQGGVDVYCISPVYLIDLACKVGYSGTNCEEKCLYPSYGKDCQSSCNCSKIDCWYVGGCINSTWEAAGHICGGYVNCVYIKNDL